MDTYRSPGVYVKEVPAGSRPIEGVGTAVAGFVGLTAQGPFNEPVRISNWGQYVRTFGEWVPGAYLPLSVYQYFNNGGGACYVMRIGENGSGGELSRASAELTSAAKAGMAVYRAEAREDGGAGDGLSIEVVPASPPEGQQEGEGDGGGETFTLVVKRDGKQVESFPDVQTRKGARNVVTVVNKDSKLIELSEVGSAPVAERLPGGGPFPLAGGSTLPARVGVDDYVGDTASRSGLGGFAALDDITMVAAPDLMAAYEQGQIDMDGVQDVQRKMIDHCRNLHDRMAILDPPPNLNAQQIKDWRVEKTGYDSEFATLYWPWINVFDPVQKRSRAMPPSGAIAGIWARTDETRGVHKAPANEVVQGALGVTTSITRYEHDELNPRGINVIRSFPGRGAVVWGARTLSSDSAWRYVNVRRLFNYVVGSILAGTQWAVFEPNDLDLWQRLNRTVSSFLLGIWRGGALFGATPDEAFYVKCDAETNPPDVIESGRVVIEVGIAPVKPAEFVVFHIAQLPSGGTVS